MFSWTNILNSKYLDELMKAKRQWVIWRCVFRFHNTYRTSFANLHHFSPLLSVGTMAEPE